MSSENYLIQTLMWRQCVTEDNFKRLVAKCLKEEDTETEMSAEKVSQMVSRVNRLMRPFGVELSRGPNETDGTVFYALINTSDNEMTRMANIWTQKELQYFRKLMAAIIESNSSSISSTKMLNIGRDDELKFSISAAETVTNKWLEQKWLEEISDGKVAIGVRTLLEMSVYIRERFEVQDCFRCKILCVRGFNCMSCDTKLHYHCFDAQFVPNNLCPNCSKQFAVTTQVTTQATGADDDDSQQMEASQSRTNDHNDSDSSEEEPVERRRSGRTKRSRLS